MTTENNVMTVELLASGLNNMLKHRTVSPGTPLVFEGGDGLHSLLPSADKNALVLSAKSIPAAE